MAQAGKTRLSTGDRLFRIGVVGIFAMQAADIVSTYAGISTGIGHEGNPVMRSVLNHAGWVGFAGAKLGFAMASAGVLVGIRALARRLRAPVRVMTTIGALAIAGASAAPLPNNAEALIGGRRTDHVTSVFPPRGSSSPSGLHHS